LYFEEEQVEFEMIVITKRTTGSEDGINVKMFDADPEPQRVEKSLAQVFVATGCAEYPKKVEKKTEPAPAIVKPAIGPKEYK
jgi:hypothetical protein